MIYTVNDFIADVYKTYGIRFKIVFDESVGHPGDKRVFPAVESEAFVPVKKTLRLSNLRENLHTLIRAAGYWGNYRIAFIDPEGREIGANTVIATAQRHYRNGAEHAFETIAATRQTVDSLSTELDRMLTDDYSTLDIEKLKKLTRTLLNSLES